MKNKTKRTIKENLLKGKGVISTIAGLGLNFAISDPTGMTGETVKKGIDIAITKMADEFDTRKLSELETNRVAEVMVYAVDDITEKLKQGQKIRDDGFFNSEIDEESDAEEIFEGIIISAQREFEKKKLKCYGRLLSNISFREDIAKDEIVQLIQIAERLSYRQYILISLIVVSQLTKLNTPNLPFLDDKMLKDRNMDYKDISIYQDIYELYRIGLLNGCGSVILEFGYISPANLEAQGVGVKLCQLMELDRRMIDKESLRDVLDILKVIKHERCNIDLASLVK